MKRRKQKQVEILQMSRKAFQAYLDQCKLSELIHKDLVPKKKK